MEHTIARWMTRWGLTRRDLLLIVLFLHRADAPSLTRGIFDYVRGLGPAATAAGRSGVHRVPSQAAIVR
jgi:hypothetical protein